MKYISREEFEERFPRRVKITERSSEYPGDLTLDNDTRLTGIVYGDVRVADGVQASITGVVKGHLQVGREATVYLIGVVEGDMHIDGNALLIGEVQGRIAGSEQAHISTGNRSWANP